MSNHRFNLRLTEKAKKILDEVERGKKNEFINNVIEKDHKEDFENKLLSELGSISNSLSIIAECLQKVNIPNNTQSTQVIDVEEEEPKDESIQKKLSDFAMKYVEL